MDQGAVRVLPEPDRCGGAEINARFRAGLIYIVAMRTLTASRDGTFWARLSIAVLGVFLFAAAAAPDGPSETRSPVFDMALTFDGEPGALAVLPKLEQNERHYGAGIVPDGGSHPALPFAGAQHGIASSTALSDHFTSAARFPQLDERTASPRAPPLHG